MRAYKRDKELIDISIRLARMEERQIAITQKIDEEIAETKKILYEVSSKVSSLEKLKAQLLIFAGGLSIALSMAWDWLYFRITGLRN